MLDLARDFSFVESVPGCLLCEMGHLHVQVLRWCRSCGVVSVTLKSSSSRQNRLERTGEPGQMK